jgi:iron-sulfur cluster insertion protein
MSLTITPSMHEKITRERTARSLPDLRLRITVEGGGCSGFQYIFAWDAAKQVDDMFFEDAVVTDPMSFPFLAGSTIDYVVSRMGEDFKITNPNASSGCGCGTSFAV